VAWNGHGRRRCAAASLCPTRACCSCWCLWAACTVREGSALGAHCRQSTGAPGAACVPGEAAAAGAHHSRCVMRACGNRQPKPYAHPYSQPCCLHSNGRRRSRGAHLRRRRALPRRLQPRRSVRARRRLRRWRLRALLQRLRRGLLRACRVVRRQRALRSRHVRRAPRGLRRCSRPCSPGAVPWGL
jgi:hypothetical protein